MDNDKGGGKETLMRDRPNYRHVQVACCGSCQHIRYTHEDEPLCVQGLPPAEGEGLGAYRPGSQAPTVDCFGVCDAYAPKDAEAPAIQRAFVAASGIVERKLDALGELVEAIGAAVVGDTYTTRHQHLARILARRWGQCEVCFGSCLVDLDGRQKTPCVACNGTGKAPARPDPADPSVTICTDRDCGHCKYAKSAKAAAGGMTCTRTGEPIKPWSVCMDFHRQQGDPDG